MAVRIADLSMKASDPAAAAVWYQQAMDASGVETMLLLRVAEAQLASGATDAARASVEKVLERDPANRTALALQRRVK
jgi:predicted TPR repeat methyltransferase